MSKFKAKSSVSITEFKKDTDGILKRAKSKPIAITNRNITTAYLVNGKAWDRMGCNLLIIVETDDQKTHVYWMPQEFPINYYHEKKSFGIKLPIIKSMYVWGSIMNPQMLSMAV